MDGRKYTQQVSAFQREMRFILTSNVKTEQGLWFLHEPIATLDTDATPTAIGGAVFQALAQTQIGVEVPDQAALDETLNGILQAANVTTYEEFLISALHCSVGRIVDEIEIAPTHNNGPQGDEPGFQFRLASTIVLANPISPHQLGVAFLQGFDACTLVDE